MSAPNLQSLHGSSWFRKIKFLFFFNSTIRLTYLFFNQKIFKILFTINEKIFDLFVFIVPYSALFYLPDNVLLCLALIRTVFRIGAIVKPN